MAENDITTVHRSDSFSVGFERQQRKTAAGQADFAGRIDLKRPILTGDVQVIGPAIIEHQDWGGLIAGGIALEIFDAQTVDGGLDGDERGLIGPLGELPAIHLAHIEIAQGDVANVAAAGWKAPAIEVDRVNPAAGGGNI